MQANQHKGNEVKKEKPKPKVEIKKQEPKKEEPKKQEPKVEEEKSESEPNERDFAKEYLATLFTKEQLAPYGTTLDEQLETYARQHVRRQSVSKYVLTVPKYIWLEEDILNSYNIEYILNIYDDDMIVRTQDERILKVYQSLIDRFKEDKFNMYTENMVPPELYKVLYSGTTDIDEYVLQLIPEQNRINWGTMPREQAQNYSAYHILQRG